MFAFLSYLFALLREVDIELVHWTISEFFCPNCGKKLSGICNKDGTVNVSCRVCFTKYKLKRKSRRLIVIEAIPFESNK
ncbi:MAG: hypothetical protein J5911_00990 [Clostridia bacterium]|nr:hypothetical protein [Clostridia bacterium]